MIGSWHDVSLSVLWVLWWSWSVYRPVPNMALPIHFFRHFCCSMSFSHSWLWDVSFSHNMQRKPNCQNFHVWNSHEQHGYVTMAIPDTSFWRFGSAAVL